jgi:hypothetical protein
VGHSQRTETILPLFLLPGDLPLRVCGLLFQYREQQQRFCGEDSLHVTPFSDGVQNTRIYVMWGEEVPTIGRGDEKFIARMKGEKAAVGCSRGWINRRAKRDSSLRRPTISQE